MKTLHLLFRVVEMDRVLAFPYLVTLGFKVKRPHPRFTVRLAEVVERLGNPVLRRQAATRVMAVVERFDDGSSAAA